jgi:putative ABC transport system permease protein
MYPEFVLSAAERKAFLSDRRGAIAGRKLADKYGWKVGDQIPLRGTIYPGTWTFNLRGIFDGARNRPTPRRSTSSSTTSTRRSSGSSRGARLRGRVRRAAARPGRRRGVSHAIDATFRNSLAETLTETEKAFQLGSCRCPRRSSPRSRP